MVHRGFIGAVIVSVMVEKKGKQPWTLREFGGKTFWDWLQLLIVPAVLSLITVAFALWQDIRQDQVEDRRTEQAQKLEDQRAEAERELAVQRAQDEALQAYLDQMSHLLLEKDLRESKEDSEVRTLARARTLTVLGRLDSERNRAILQFLREAKLINGTDPVVTLSSSDLSGAELRSVELSEIDLSDADLHKADLTWAELSRADLSGAELYKTDLINANLIHANFSGAYMGSADLFGAFLDKANLSVTDMYATSLIYAQLSSADLSSAHMIKTDLSHADLSHADLSDATLGQSDLHKANLSHANLSHASLHKANLSGARGVTNEELAQQAETLEGATMPSGQKYEEWIKDKEGRKEDAENE